MAEAPVEDESPRRPLTRARKACCGAHIKISLLPVELQQAVFDAYVWMGPERPMKMLVEDAKEQLERIMTIRLVYKGTAIRYFGEMVKLKFQLHMKMRSQERNADPNKNQMLRSIFYRCADAADLAAGALYSAMAPHNDQAAFDGLKQVLGMHKDQAEAWEAVEKEHPTLMQNFPGM